MAVKEKKLMKEFSNIIAALELKSDKFQELEKSLYVRDIALGYGVL